MSGLRRFVIGLVNGLLLLIIILATIIGALRGLAFSHFVGFFRNTDMPYEAYAIPAFVIGGFAEFLLASIPAVIVFLLTEIAQNTRQTMLAVKGGNRRTQWSSDTPAAARNWPE